MLEEFFDTKVASTLSRYPISTVLALVSIPLLSYSITLGQGEMFVWFLAFVHSVILLICLETGLHHYKVKAIRRAAVAVTCSIGSLILFRYVVLVWEVSGEHWFVYQLHVLTISVLILSFCPTFFNSSPLSWWSFNYQCLKGFTVSALLSAIIFALLAGAVFSAQRLFDFSVADEFYYSWLFPVCACGVFTFLFLIAVPHINGLVPPLSSIFFLTWRILMLVAVIYAAIVFVYTGKILLEASWPKGTVAVTTLILLSLCMGLWLAGFGSMQRTRDFRIFESVAFLMMVPVSMLLLSAIWRRVSEYGWTVNRYYLFLTGLYFLIITLSFSFKKTRCYPQLAIGGALILGLLTVNGPLSAYSIAGHEQRVTTGLTPVDSDNNSR